MSDASFDNTMVRLKYRVNTRMIYNDIRAESEVTDTSQVAEEGLGDSQSAEAVQSGGAGFTGWSYPVYLYAKAEAVAVNWGSPSISVTPVPPLPLPELSISVAGSGRSAGGFWIKIQITSTNAPYGAAYSLRIPYTYQQSVIRYREETNQRTLLVRSIDQTSIDKYGQRTMSLDWPLGQTQTQMQSTVDAYRDKHMDPAPEVVMEITGRTAAMVQQIMDRAVGDCITVIEDTLGLSRDFWIVASRVWKDLVDIAHGEYTLEPVRASETATLFRIGVSLIGGTHVLG